MEKLHVNKIGYKRPYNYICIYYIYIYIYICSLIIVHLATTNTKPNHNENEQVNVHFVGTTKQSLFLMKTNNISSLIYTNIMHLCILYIVYSMRQKREIQYMKQFNLHKNKRKQYDILR
jgi:hypothetical protein